MFIEVLLAQEAACIFVTGKYPEAKSESLHLGCHILNPYDALNSV